MRIFSALCTVALGTTVAGCSIHPQTDDFSRSAVPDIAFRVRCEASEAVKAVFPKSHETNYLYRTAIDFEFEFVMTETNDKSAEGSFTIPVHVGTFKIGWDAGANKGRETTQTVRFGETFRGLADNVDCAKYEKSSNFKYPITGQIGIIDTMTNLRRLVDVKRGKELVEFTDKVEFTTTLSAGLHPSISLSPASGRNVSAEATFKASRKDVHRLTMTFALPFTPEQLAAKRAEDNEEARLALAADIARDAALKKTPVRVQLLDAQGNPVSPNAAAAGAIEPKTQSQTTTPRAGATPSATAGAPAARSLSVPTRQQPSEQDLLERARRQADRNKDLKLLEDIRRELRQR
jgi:hypothetical protein